MKPQTEWLSQHKNIRRNAFIYWAWSSCCLHFIMIHLIGEIKWLRYCLLCELGSDTWRRMKRRHMTACPSILYLWPLGGFGCHVEVYNSRTVPPPRSGVAVAGLVGQNGESGSKVRMMQLLPALWAVVKCLSGRCRCVGEISSEQI